MHEGKGKAYDKREKGKAGDPKGKRERPRTGNLIRDPTRQPDRAHARTHARHKTNSRIRGACLKANSLPPTSDPFYVFVTSRAKIKDGELFGTSNETDLLHAHVSVSEKRCSGMTTFLGLFGLFCVIDVLQKVAKKRTGSVSTMDHFAIN